MTKLFLSSIDQHYRELTLEIAKKSKYVLATYYYLKTKSNDDKLMDLLKKYNERGRLIIDSGAFSFMNGKQITEPNLDQYCEQYVKFLKQYKIKNFVEMDIDAIFGYSKALEYRNFIENSMNKQCIPIWHKSRGKAEFKKMVEQYSYAGIGGIAIKNIKRNEWKFFKELNDFAKYNHCKMHAMGFTPTHDLNAYGFYSSDSSSWTTGPRFGQLYRFNGSKITTLKKPPHSRLVLSQKQIQQFNWNEWCKYQKFVDK